MSSCIFVNPSCPALATAWIDGLFAAAFSRLNHFWKFFHFIELLRAGDVKEWIRLNRVARTESWGINNQITHGI
jgi:hypothetical protein